MSLVSTEERMKAGRALRRKVPRKTHAGWKPPSDRPDPIELLIASDQGRIAELLPIRYGRMRKSPFTFLRGAAAIMACDLARTPTTKVRVQAGGDCHIMNFGAFATPERNLIFDINDFDETLPAPFEWDLKRLVTSIDVAGRSAGSKSKDRAKATRAALGTYRERIAAYARMAAIEVWYERIDFGPLIKQLPQPHAHARGRKAIEKARRKSTPSHILPTLAKGVRDEIKDDPPLIFHEAEQRKPAYLREMEVGFRRYRESLAPSVRVLFDRYRLRDVALKVVGVGSVGTYCEAALFTDAQGEPLFLQLKEARASVLEQYAGKSAFAYHGERVVVGQRLMQAASDIFLGWTLEPESGRHFYVRQLRDLKVPMPMDTSNPADLAYFAEACGWALARAHARSGDPAMIAGYLGSSDSFDDALVKFAADYADQTERDHTALLKAIKQGRIKAEDA
jgi:uncharacterized protein (DUF2252 family)